MGNQIYKLLNMDEAETKELLSNAYKDGLSLSTITHEFYHNIDVRGVHKTELPLLVNKLREAIKVAREEATTYEPDVRKRQIEYAKKLPEYNIYELIGLTRSYVESELQVAVGMEIPFEDITKRLDNWDVYHDQSINFPVHIFHILADELVRLVGYRDEDDIDVAKYHLRHYDNSEIAEMLVDARKGVFINDLSDINKREGSFALLMAYQTLIREKGLSHWRDRT